MKIPGVPTDGQEDIAIVYRLFSSTRYPLPRAIQNKATNLIHPPFSSSSLENTSHPHLRQEDIAMRLFGNFYSAGGTQGLLDIACDGDQSVLPEELIFCHMDMGENLP